MTRKASGGRGGDADVSGEDSSAKGGLGGDAVHGDGGDGGHATVASDRSHASGGAGGRGGIGPGGKGGQAHVLSDTASLESFSGKEEHEYLSIEPSDTYIVVGGKIVLLARGGKNGNSGGDGGSGYAVGGDSKVFGGQGGEAPQPNGRGGRGGRTFKSKTVAGARQKAHMRWPYYEPVTEPGRGGDGADSPQYKARRLIVEQLKKRFFARQGFPLEAAWWDRELVPLAWINAQLVADGHRWYAIVDDDEYEFHDSHSTCVCHRGPTSS